LLATADTVTTTFPVVAPAGTVATMLVALQEVTDVAAVPLKVTVLIPCVAPKLLPVMVMAAPTAPETWLRLVMIAGTTKHDHVARGGSGRHRDYDTGGAP
jgi:hypothetical protein